MLRLLPTLRPRRLQPRGSHGLAARLFAPLILHVGCHVKREGLEPDSRSLTLTRPSPKASPFSVEKLPGSRSRGGGHTNSSGHLPLPGACGVHTPRRRSEQARGERSRVGRRGREEEREGGARGTVWVLVSRRGEPASVFGHFARA